MTQQCYRDGSKLIFPDEMREIWAKSSKDNFYALGVTIAAGYVWKIKTFGQPQIIGPLKGAYAGVTDRTPVHRVGAAVTAGMFTGPAGLLVGLSKKTKAASLVMLADGTTVERKLDGNGSVRRAQQEAVRFNARAQAA